MTCSATAPACRGRSSASRRQAVAGDGDQLGVGAAGVQAGAGVGQVAQRRLAEDLARGAAEEGRAAGEDLAEDRAQREDVGALVDPVALAAGLLGGHVGRRAHHRAGARQAGVAGAAAGRGDDRLLAIEPCRPSSSSTTPPRGRTLARPQSITWTSPKDADHDVGRLQVAVDHAAGVGVGDGLGDGLEDRQEAGPVVVGAVARSSSNSRQGVALDQLHGEEGPEVGEGAQLVDRHDAGVLELAADLGLLDEAADHVGVVAEVVAQDLERDVAAEVGVAALED